MARFDTSGLDGIISEMEQEGELVGETADEMLMAGAEQVKIAWKRSAEMHKHKDTGEMIASIGYARRPKNINGNKSIDIYPHGKASSGTYRPKLAHGRHGKSIPLTNAAKAFITHYGTSRIPGSHWVDDADAMAGPLVEQAMREIWDRRKGRK